jgi:hypothetical protein
VAGDHAHVLAIGGASCNDRSYCLPLPPELVPWAVALTCAIFIAALVWAYVTIRRRRRG